MARFIAIDADAHGLIIAAGGAARGKLTVDRLIAATDVAQPITPATAQVIGERLKQLLKETKISAAPALVSIGRDRVILKDIKHPPVPPADEPGLVRFQTLKELGDSADDVVIDYQPLASGDCPERRAAVACLKQDTYKAIRKVCEVAGLKLAAVTPRPHAVVALLGRAAAMGLVPPPDPADGPVAVLLLTEAGGEFTVCRHGTVTFTRHLPVTLFGREDTLLTEIRRNLAVAAGQTGNDVQALYVAEANPPGDGWSGRLRAELELPVYPFDPLAGVPGGEPIPPELHGRFAGPIGLLIARGATGPLPINFAQPRQPRRQAETTPQKRRMLLFTLAACVLLGVLGIGGWFLVSMEEGKVAQLRTQIATAEEDIKTGELNAKRLAAVEEYVARDINWLDELYDLSVMFPDHKQMKITQWDGKVNALPSEKDRTAAAAVPPAKNAPPKRVATATITAVTENHDLPTKLTADLNIDTRNYAGAGKKIGTKSNSKSNAQQFVIDVGLVHRAPADFTKKLIAAFPKLPDPVDEKKPDDGDGKDAKDAKVNDDEPAKSAEEKK